MGTCTHLCLPKVALELSFQLPVANKAATRFVADESNLVFMHVVNFLFF